MNETLKDLFESMERAIKYAYSGSAEHGSFLRANGAEYSPSVFLMLDNLRERIKASTTDAAEYSTDLAKRMNEGDWEAATHIAIWKIDQVYQELKEANVTLAARTAAVFNAITEQERLTDQDRCILDLDSPSYPPTDEERRQCGCKSCLGHLVGTLTVEQQRLKQEHGEYVAQHFDDAERTDLRAKNILLTASLEAALKSEEAAGKGWREAIEANRLAVAEIAVLATRLAALVSGLTTLEQEWQNRLIAWRLIPIEHRLSGHGDMREAVALCLNQIQALITATQ